ncbi:MAG: radical SAM protein [Planctomycetes bacterium]|nr:radical SAM protein [Planctomycetota bacterium]MBL7186745.1 radical SAM protein [Phycisphaerae bacterium]
MAFYKITHNPKYRFATLHNYGCTFRCPVCSYKLRSGEDGKAGHAYPRPEQFLKTDEIKQKLMQVDIETLFFMGGEPTIAPDLPGLLEFASNTLKVRTCLGHTNGSRLPMPNLDGANVGLKAWDEKTHLEYTGREKKLIFDNFKEAHEAGIELKANVVYIPGFVDCDQVESIAAWLAELSPEIPFHIMGYIPVPGQPFQSPTAEQMSDAVKTCRKYLTHVNSSQLSSEQALNLAGRDDRFDVKRIA